MATMSRIMECVPNFSEGRDKDKINQIVEAISSVKGVKVLHVDIGKGANRTVVTFVGEPESVVEAAFAAVQKAAEVIDMSLHHGEHPRFGATDVLPLIPISGISMDEAVDFARKLGKRIGDELKISVFSYAEAAFDSRRRELSYCRAGEYEGLAKKMATTDGNPDFGPKELNVRSGAIAVGARDFLIAYNVNLNTESVGIANEIAAAVRESGRKIKTDKGTFVHHPGALKAVKAIGWYMPEFQSAQVSMNLTKISETSLHRAFEEVRKEAEKRGVKVTGSEIVGLVPLRSMIDAGIYFSNDSAISEKTAVEVAVERFGLNDKNTFDPNEKIIEYVMK